MADQKTNGQGWIVGLVIAAIVSGGVGLLFISSQQSAKNQQNLIDNLPAVQAQLTIVRGEVEAIKSSTLSRGEVEAKLEAFAERLNALEGQISRRFSEVVSQPLSIVRDDVEDNEGKIEILLADVARLEAEIKALNP